MEVSSYDHFDNCRFQVDPRHIELGFLVFGPEKVEKGFKKLERRFLEVTENAKVWTDTRIRSTWKNKKQYLEASGINVSALERNIESFQAQLGHVTEKLVSRIEMRLKKALAFVLHRMITLLENVGRRLDSTSLG